MVSFFQGRGGEASTRAVAIGAEESEKEKDSGGGRNNQTW